MTQPAVFDLLLRPPAQVARLDVRLPGLRGILERLCWTQSDFAQRAGTARVTINRVVQGRPCALETALSVLSALESAEREMTVGERGRLTGHAWRKAVNRTTLVKLLLDQPVVAEDDESDENDVREAAAKDRPATD